MAQMEQLKFYQFITTRDTCKMSKSFHSAKIDNNEREVTLIIFYYHLLRCLSELRAGSAMFWARKPDG